MANPPTSIIIGGETNNAEIAQALAAAQAAGQYTPPATGATAVPMATLLQDLYGLRSLGANLNGAASIGVTTKAGVLVSTATFQGTSDLAYLQALVNAAGTFNDPPIGLSADWDLGTGTNNNNLPQGIARLPSGSIFAINGTLTVPPGVKIEGNNSTILQLSLEKIPSISIQNNGTSGYDFTAMSKNDIEDLVLWGGSSQINATGDGLATGQLGVGIVFSGQGASIRRCTIGGFRVGIDVWSSQYSNLYDNQVQGNVHNIIVRNAPGGTLPAIDMKLGGNNRYAKSVGGYGIWVQDTGNVTIDQVDANFCGKAMLVLGGALPTYLSRVLTITNPGAGYTPGTFPLLAVSDGRNPSLRGFASVNSAGQIAAAYITDGLGDGLGVNASAVSITVTGQSPTTPATFGHTVVNDAVSFADLMTTPDAPNSTTPITLGASIKIDNFKAEVASQAGPNGTVGAPDSCTVIFGDSNSSLKINVASISDYDRGVDNYYRWAYLLGAADITVESFDTEDATLANPGAASGVAGVYSYNGPNQPTQFAAANPGDFGLFKVINTATTTAAIRVRLPHNSDIAYFERFVIDSNNNPAVGGTQVYMESTLADQKVCTGLTVRNGAYGANARITVINPTPEYAGTAVDAFVVDGTGKTHVTGLTCVPYFTDYSYYTANLVFDFAQAMIQYGTVSSGATTALVFKNGVAGTWYDVDVIQDSTGSRAWAINSHTASGNPSDLPVLYQGGVVPTPSTAAGATDHLRVYCTGASYLVVPFLNFH